MRTVDFGGRGRGRIWIGLGLALVSALLASSLSSSYPKGFADASLGISGLTAGSPSVPLYDKFEITFNVDNSVATNPQFPYDPDTPPGLAAGIGISVEGQFLPPGETDWQNAVRQPGFLYQDYERQQFGKEEWLYPRGYPVWKVRFAPKIVGDWQYRLRVQDGSTYPGWIESETGIFTATGPAPGKHGFVEVSKTDPRYFAFSDGSRFVGVGHNSAFYDLHSTLDADSRLSLYGANGVDFIRTWMSGTDVAGSAWSPWALFPDQDYGSMPEPGLDNAPPASGCDYTFTLNQQEKRLAIFNGWTQGHIAVKPDTSYRLSATVRVANVAGPRNAGNPEYGFTVKQAGWAKNDDVDTLSAYPALIPHLHDSGWKTVTGDFTTKPDQYFLDYLYLLLENVSTGEADVAEVSLKEILPGGSLGPEVLVKSRSDMHMDFNLAASWRWDYVLDLAAQKDVYLKLVVLEKNDRVWDRTNPDGSLSTSDFDNNNFYDSDHTKVRRLQEYFWRYLAARWGYSPPVHSWELLNEGDPFNGAHYDQANEFARFLAEWDRNHMATTSFWHSYPVEQFWNNPAYPFPAYADLHAYSDTSPIRLDPHDAASFHLALSQWVHSFGVGKPTVRAETGMTGTNGEVPDLAKDRRGVWLHNFTWAQLDSGAMYDLYWYTANIVKNDLYFQYKPFVEFMRTIPLDNGHYQDARAAASDPNVRVLGQTDTTNGRVHLWLQNRGHTWWNAINGGGWGQLSGTVTAPGFLPNQGYPVEYWLFDDPGNLTRQHGVLVADGSGQLVLDLAAFPIDTTDLAVKIGDYPAQ